MKKILFIIALFTILSCVSLAQIANPIKSTILEITGRADEIINVDIDLDGNDELIVASNRTARIYILNTNEDNQWYIADSMIFPDKYKNGYTVECPYNIV